MIHHATNGSITKETRPMVEAIARFTARADVLDVLKAAQQKASLQLRADTSLPAAVESVDLTSLANPIDGVGSIRVAVIRAGFDGGNERHPNSTQYLFSLEGTGETHVKIGDDWRIDRYGQGSNLEDRFHVVPQGVWHKSAAPGVTDWTVVALHTARHVQDDYDYK